LGRLKLFVELSDVIQIAVSGVSSVEIAEFDSVLSAAHEGSEWAWEILVRRLAPSLLRFFRVRGVPDPEALVGEVLVDMARNLGTFQGGYTAFRSWVFVIAYRRMADEWRRLRRRPDETPQGMPPESDRLAPSAEDEAMEHLGDVEAAEMLSCLTEEQRDVIALRVVAGLTLAETARATGKRIGAVKALQRRAIATLRRDLERRGVSK
jgi:RNA polymerase sigma factor (sigma-70 family)